MSIQRNTVQRKIILDALIKLNTHPAVDEVYAEVHKNHQSISKATVYRNLRQLAENKIIRSVSIPDGLERYDGRNSQHYHFKCSNCENIYDVDIEYIDSIDETVFKKYGFQIERHDIIFTGICKQCREICKQK